MKKIMDKCVMATLLSVMSMAVVADTQAITPYVGLDAQWRQLSLKKNFGKNMTQKDFPQGNAYMGIMFQDSFGVELGYETITKRSKKVTIRGTNSYFNFVYPEGFAPLDMTTKTALHGVHANLVGFLPISDDQQSKFVGSLGLAQLKMYIRNEIPRFNQVLEFKKTKWIPRVGAGIQHHLSEQFGIRAMIHWEKTSVFKKMAPINVPSILRASAKDSLQIGLGLFCNF